jgi:nuclear pore complex protein Nup188
MNLATPKCLIEKASSKSESSHHNDDWTNNDWWNVYTKGIQLVRILLESEKHLFIKDALFFIAIHEQYLIDVLSIAKYSLEPNALTLMKSTLELIYEVLKYENSWSADYKETIYNLTVSFKINL